MGVNKGDYEEVYIKPTSFDSIHFYAYLNNLGYSKSTINLYIRYLARLFRFIGNDIFKDLKLGKGSHLKSAEALTDNEVLMVLERAKDYQLYYPAICLLYGQGARISEVLSLRYQDFQLGGPGANLISFKQTKTGVVRQALINDWVLDALNPLFSSPHKPSDKLFSFNRLSVWRCLRQIGRGLGLTKRVHPHGARASAITSLLDKGVSTRNVARISGHNSLKSIEGYDKRRLEPTNEIVKLNYK